MAKLESSYHLPHNAIRVDEFEFMLNCIDTTKVSYTYSELRLLFFKEEVLNHVFTIFHPVPHNNLTHHKSEVIRLLYQKAVAGDETAIEMLLTPNIAYTDRKTWKQVWNEYVRDYTEFFAFLGVLPSYYKGVNGGVDSHLVTPLLRRFQNKEVSLQDLILNFKFRNASKDYKSLDMYHIEVRPFVLALKALRHYQRLGFKKINPHIISAIVSYSKNEFDSLEDCLAAFPDPMLSIRECSSAFIELTSSVEKEIGRVTLFLKPYLITMRAVGTVQVGRSTYYTIAPELESIAFPEKTVFCNGDFGKFKLTPMIGKVIASCYNNCGKSLTFSKLFDENFNTSDKDAIVSELKSLGVVECYTSSSVLVSALNKQYSINPYSDFMTISEAEYVDSCMTMHLHDKQQIVMQENRELSYDAKKLQDAALGSDGTLYEKRLYEFINKHLCVFNNLKWFGQASTGNRLSDIAATIKVYSNGEEKNILLIIECKAGNAIAAFNERKEREDIINTIKKFEYVDYDGVWYWVADSNSLPEVSVHGGYRESELKKSLPEKLNVLQFEISEQTRRPSIVTAFSIDALVSYLTYLVQVTSSLSSKDPVTEVRVPHFWKWSKKFMNLQYVTIHKHIAI